MNDSYRSWAARWRVPLGFALGIAYLLLAQPTPRLGVAGGALALAGIGVRTLAAGYLEKDKRLATGGPYQYTRNPLYFGSFLMGSGFAMAGNSLSLGLAFLSLFLVVYWPVMSREATALRYQFGEAYNDYARRVPLFFPFGPFGPSGRLRGTEGSLLVSLAWDSKFSWERYRRNREYRAALGVLGGLTFLALKMVLR